MRLERQCFLVFCCFIACIADVHAPPAGLAAKPSVNVTGGQFTFGFALQAGAEQQDGEQGQETQQEEDVQQEESSSSDSSSSDSSDSSSDDDADKLAAPQPVQAAAPVQSAQPVQSAPLVPAVQQPAQADTAPHAEGHYIPRRVYVGGLPFAASEEELREVWGECGAIESLDMLTFADSGKFKGIAFITFATVGPVGVSWGKGNV